MILEQLIDLCISLQRDWNNFINNQDPSLLEELNRVNPNPPLVIDKDFIIYEWNKQEEK